MSSSTDLSSKRLKTDAIIIPSFGQSFAPKVTVSRTYGKETINIYPTGDYNLAEKAYDFTHDKNVLDNSSISRKNQITLMGEFHNGTTTVNIKLKHFRAITNGTVIPSCLNANNVLKLVQAGAAANCCPFDIMYAHMKALINLTALDDKTKPKITMIYFLCLPMADQTVICNGRNTVINTFDGPSNWTTSAPPSFVSLIYDHPDAIKEMFNVQTPTFASTEATINREDKVKELEKKIVNAAYPSHPSWL
eukprot:scaffold49697_cov62-Attheya_sp.AAC.3